MAVVQGIREKVHFPIYDSIFVKPKEQLRDVENVNSSILKFFVDVQGKTKLETNLQSASLLPHYNTFEARAMRVVISDFIPQFPDEDAATVTVEDSEVKDPAGNTVANVTAVVTLGLDAAMAKLREAQDSDDGTALFDYGTEDVNDKTVTRSDGSTAAGTVVLTLDGLEAALEDMGKSGPPDEQIATDDGGRLIQSFLYNTVTTLFVGEKIMIQAPTWLFPAGGGPSSDGKFTTHGEPSPTATFRFAEPVTVDKQQNFRVEIEVPNSEVFQNFQKIYGPFYLWVFLDGYMMRDVQ
jgi:hypothetical protein